MKSNLLPFYKTGWLYLLVVLWCGLFWSSQQGYFDEINQWNRNLLFDLTERKAAPSDSKSANLIRINSDWQNTDSDLLVKLLRQNSEADVLLIGQASDKELARLNQHLANSMRKGSVIVGVDDPYLTKNIRYKTQLPEWLFNFLNQFRAFDIEEKFQRQFSDLLLLSLSNQKKSATFSRNNYLLNGEISLLGLLSNNQKNIQLNYIDANWNLNLNLDKSYWQLGFVGQLYYPKVSEKKQNDFSIDNYLQSLDTTKVKSEFVIIHDGSYANIDQVESNLKTLFNKEYRYQSLLIIFIQFIYLIFGLYILWYIKRYKKLILFAGTILLLASLSIFQYISFTQMQWVAAFPIALSWLATLGLILAYQNEIHSLEKIQAKHNELLAHAVSIFYETQNFDKIQPLLMQTNPDLTLVEKVFDVALQAESKNNLQIGRAHV